MKRQLLISIILSTIFLITIKSQNHNITWKKGDNFPIRLSEVKAITCNDNIYVIGGKITNDNSDMSDNENVDYTYEYNCKNNKWSKKSNLPFKDYDITLAKVNDKIYAIGSKTAMYDPLTDKWELREPFGYSGRY